MESGLKQRIIGAVVLVVAAVIFLPMLLSGQDETERVEVSVPERPVMDDTDMAVAPSPTLPEPAPVPDLPLPAETPATAPEQVEELAVIEAPTEPVSAPAPEPEPSASERPTSAEPASTAPAVDGGWVVQQASFSSRSNADNFRQTLAGQGYNAYVRSAEVGGKTIARVYVGPLTTREAANRVRDELERRHQNKGMVVAYDDATRAP